MTKPYISPMALEEYAQGKSPLHQAPTGLKVLLTLVLLVLVISSKPFSLPPLLYGLGGIWLLAAIAGIPLQPLHHRFLLVLPFPFLAGVANLWTFREPGLVLGPITFSFGMLSLLVLLAKAYLTVMLTLLLLSTTPWFSLLSFLKRCHVPSLFLTVLTLTYRYLTVLSEEALSMKTAYQLRSGGKGIRGKDIGSLLGNLFLRSYDRAQRIYLAMQCRGWEND